MTVLGNAMVGAFLHTANPAEAEKRAEEALEMVDLDEMKHRSTRSLTLVDRKRLEMARGALLLARRCCSWTRCYLG